MAIDNFRGTQIGYDPTVKQKIEDQLTGLTPDEVRGQVITITHRPLLFTTPCTAGCDSPNTLAITC